MTELPPNLHHNTHVGNTTAIAGRKIFRAAAVTLATLVVSTVAAHLFNTTAAAKATLSLGWSGTESVATRGHDEGSTVPLSFLVKSTIPPRKDITVQISASPTANSYNCISESIEPFTMRANENSKEFTLTVPDDNINRGTCSVQIVLDSNTDDYDVVVGQNFIFLDVTDNDPVRTPSPGTPSEFSISNKSGSESIDTIDFVVTLTPGTSATTMVTYTITPGTTEFGGDINLATDDYEGVCTSLGVCSLTGQLVFQPNERNKTLSVKPKDDMLDEADETFTITLSSPTGGTPAPIISSNQGTATGTILDDDPLPNVSITATNATIMEGDSGRTAVPYMVSLNTMSTRDVTVGIEAAPPSNLLTASQLPESGINVFHDFTLGTDMIRIPAGTTQVSANAIILADEVPEYDEKFQLRIKDNPTNAERSGSNRSVDITIDNDDGSALWIDDLTLAEGDSGNTSFNFKVRSNETAASNLTFDWVTSDGTATTAGSDYTAVSNGSGNIANSNETDVTVNVTGDSDPEPDESFGVTISNAMMGGSPVPILDAEATGTIRNDDGIGIHIDGVSMNEGDSGSTTFMFRVWLTEASGSDVTFDWMTANGTATTEDSDYTAANQTGQTIDAGKLEIFLPVTVTGDGTVEPAETFTVTISNASTGVTISTPTATGTITNDDGPGLKIDDLTMAEGTGSTDTTFQFQVRLVRSAEIMQHPVTFDIALGDGTATTLGNSDFVTPTTTTGLQIGMNEVMGTVEVTVKADNIAEFDENFTVTISNAMANGSPVTILDAVATGTIENDDGVALYIDNLTMNEGSGSTTEFDITVRLNESASHAVTFDWMTTDGTATAGNDFTARTNSETIPMGQTEHTISVNVEGDIVPEGDETFGITLSNAMSNSVATTINDNTAMVTILNDDGLGVSISDVTMNEGDGSDTTFTFVAQLNQVPDSGSVTFDWTTVDGTATSVEGTSKDFNAGSANDVTILNTTRQAMIEVTVKADMVPEGNETFQIVLSDVKLGNMHIPVLNPEITGTITNDDDLGLWVDDVTQMEGGPGESTMFQFKVRANTEVENAVTFNWNTTDGTAESTDGALQDFVPQSNSSGEIETGKSETFITVIVNGDDRPELDEEFTVTLSNPMTTGSTVTLQDPTATGTITNDDQLAISIADLEMNEGVAGGTTMFNFRVSLNGETSDLVTFDWVTADGDPTILVGEPATSAAGVNQDYMAGSGTGEQITTDKDHTFVTVLVNGDGRAEDDDIFTVTISAATAGGNSLPISKATATGTILNDDGIILEIEDVTIDEGNGERLPDGTILHKTAFNFTVKTNKRAQHTITFDWTTTDGTATSAAGEDQDFQPANGSNKAIPQGEKKTTVRVEAVQDRAAESNETFTVTISNGMSDGNMVTIRRDQATGTIRNDDGYTISVEDAQPIDEGVAGTTTMISFTVRLSHPTRSIITFNYSTMDGTAVSVGSNPDFMAETNSSDTIAVDSDTGLLRVSIVGDADPEYQESFTVVLNSATAANGESIALDRTTATGRINNDDGLLLEIKDDNHAEGSATNDFTFTIQLNQDPGGTVLVDWVTSDGTAVAGEDYVAKSFPGGRISQQRITIAVQVIGDTDPEADETFTVTLSNARFQGAQVPIHRAQATGTIENDDGIGIWIDDAQVMEGQTAGSHSSLTFTVRLNETAQNNVTFSWMTAVETMLEHELEGATADTDYVSVTSDTGTISVGQPSTTIVVMITHDDVTEFDEKFKVVLSNGMSAGNTVVIVDAEATGTILTDDRMGLWIFDSQVDEGDSGETSLYFDVRLSHAAPSRLNFIWNTSDGTATSTAGENQDFMVGRDTPHFIEKDEKHATIEILIVGDDRAEMDEDFTIRLSSIIFVDPTFSIIGGVRSATGTILNDDREGIKIDSITMDEGTTGDTQFVFVVRLDTDAQHDVTFDWSTTDGTATSTDGPDQDFVAVTVANGRIEAMEDRVEIMVTVKGDATIEDVENFTVTVTNAKSGQSGNDDFEIVRGTATATIDNDDGLGLSIENVTAAEPDAGQTAIFTFVVRLNQEAPDAVTFTWSTSDGTAISAAGTDQDFVAQTDVSETISQNSRNAMLMVTVNGDDLPESNEEFTVTLSNPALTGSTDTVQFIDNLNTATGTIENDDGYGISIEDLSKAEGDGGQTVFNFNVRLNQVPDAPISFDWTTFDDTAKVGEDFQVGDNTTNVTISGSIATQQATVSVTVLGDRDPEGDEQFKVRLSNLSSTSTQPLSILDGEAIGTIENDDGLSLRINGVERSEGNSGNTVFQFEVNLNVLAEEEVSFEWSTADGTAISAPGQNPDYESVSVRTETIAKDQPGTTLMVNVNGDGTPEIDETFTVTISNAMMGGNSIPIMDDGMATGTIQNDDGIAMWIEDLELNEGDSGTTTFNFQVRISPSSSHEVTYDWTTVDGTATAPEDYTQDSGEDVRIQSNATTSVIPVDVVGNDVSEGDETFTVRLSDATSTGSETITIIDAVATGTIKDDDELTISIEDVAKLEGNSGSTVFEFKVKLSKTSADPVTFDVATNDGTAQAPGDYALVNRTGVTIAPNETETTIEVMVVGDVDPEAEESFTVVISNAMSGGNPVTIAVDTATGTIQTEDGLPSISFSQDAYPVFESASSVTLTLRMSYPITDPVIATANTTQDTVTEEEFQPLISNQITFSPGETTKDFSVNLMLNKQKDNHRRFFVDVTVGANATVEGSDDKITATVHIVNIEAGVVLVSINAANDSIRAGESATWMIEANTLDQGGNVVRYGGNLPNVGLTARQTGNFLAFRVPRFVNISGGLHTLTTGSTNDLEANENGLLRIELAQPVGNAYQLHPIARSAEVEVRRTIPAGRVSIAAIALRDILQSQVPAQSSGVSQTEAVNAQPVISIGVVNSTVNEGEPAIFAINASFSSRSGISIAVKVTKSGGVENKNLVVPINLAAGSTLAHHEVNTVNDDIAEEDGRITAEVVSGMGYEVGTENKATVLVSDSVDRENRRNYLTEVSRTVLPNFLASIGARSLDAVAFRADETFATGGGNRVNFGDGSSITSIITTGGEQLNDNSPDWKKVFGDASISMALLPEEDGTNRSSVWGLTDHRNVVSGSGNGGESLDGDMFTGHFGFDTKVNDGTLLGLAASVADSTALHGTGNGEVKVESLSTGIHPYLGLISTATGTELEVIAGYGTSRVGLTQVNYNTDFIDSSFATLGLSGNMPVLEQGIFADRDFALELTGQSWMAHQQISSDTKAIRDLNISVMHMRVVAETRHQYQLDEGNSLTTSSTIGIRSDRKNHETTSQMELGAESSHVTSFGLLTRGEGLTLFGSTTGISHYEMSGLLDYDRNRDSLGTLLKFNPEWGNSDDAHKGFEWNRELLNEPNSTPLVDGLRLNAEFGYGIEILDGTGIATPFTAVKSTESNDSKYHLGSRMRMGSNLEVQLEGIWIPSQSDGTSRELNLNGLVNW